MVGDLALYSHILLGIKQKIWNKTTFIKGSPAYLLHEIWENNDLIDTYGLTSTGKDMVNNFEFLKYELAIAVKQSQEYNYDLGNWEYDMLRTGLGKQFNTGIRDTFLVKTDEYTRGQDVFLDLGCGSGAYAKALLTRHELQSAVLIDRKVEFTHERANYIEADFTEYNWWGAEPFNYILAIQVLHCLTDGELLFIMDKLHKAIKPGGYLIVGEQYPSARMIFRMKNTTDGEMWYPSVLNHIVCKDSSFRFLNTFTTKYEMYFSIYRIIK